MRRRDFVLALGAAAAGRPPAAGAQQRSKPFRIGLLSPAARSSTRVLEAFRQGMRELGYVEEQTIVIEYRLAAGDLNRLSDMAAELVRSGVDIIVGDGGRRVAQILQTATRTIPIVM